MENDFQETKEEHMQWLITAAKLASDPKNWIKLSGRPIEEVRSMLFNDKVVIEI